MKQHGWAVCTCSDSGCIMVHELSPEVCGGLSGSSVVCLSCGLHEHTHQCMTRKDSCTQDQPRPGAVTNRVSQGIWRVAVTYRESLLCCGKQLQWTGPARAGAVVLVSGVWSGCRPKRAVQPSLCGNCGGCGMMFGRACILMSCPASSKFMP